MAEILIGTSGFFYDDWKGKFYHRDVRKENYLRYYALHFKAIELNYSYYRIPKKKQSRRMVESSEGRLRFVIKANRLMTHEVSDDSIKKILPLFIEGISPFMENNLLGAILLQFPQGFHYTHENRYYLKSLIEALHPLPVSVEFRQKEWLKDSVYETLQALDSGFVCVDEPSLPALIPPVLIKTSSLAYIRFHGRNKENWYGTDSRSRYDYLYTEDELKEWMPKIMELSRETKKLFVFFNNHAKAQAVTNAKMLISLLENTQGSY